MSKIGIFAYSQIDKAYSCFIYLKRFLKTSYKQVKLWSFSEKSKLELEDRESYFSFSDSLLGRIRHLRFFYSNIKFFHEAIKCDVIIIQDLSFFIMAYLLKLLYPKKLIIQYNTEIHGKDVRYPKIVTKFYEKKANFPDMIIECLEERANYRRKTFKINKPIYVINNTLPLTVITNNYRLNYDIDKYFTFENQNPVLIYAGGCNLSRNLGDIIFCCSEFKDRVNFLFFCYGNDSDYKVIENLCAMHANCRLFHAIDREELITVMFKCDIGIQYYEPNYSINHKYAAPSKFFEYLATGLNILSSNNEGINNIITKYNLGICLKDNETIKEGLNRLLEKGLEQKETIQQLFRDKYCYEIDSRKTIDALLAMIESIEKV